MQENISRKLSTISLSIRQFLKFEDLLDKLGGFGKFQILILVLLLTLEIPAAFVTFIPIFVAGKGTWYCENDTEFDIVSDDICSCNGTIIPMSEDSIVIEWSLICDKAWVADFIMSIQMLGMFVGNIYGSQFADWYGRKKGFMLGTLILALGSAVSAAAPNPYIYAIARFLCGAGIPTFINITSMAVMEFMPLSYRSLSSAIGPTGEGIIILSILGYYIRPWRSLYWITIAPFSLIFVLYPLSFKSFWDTIPQCVIRFTSLKHKSQLLQKCSGLATYLGISFTMVYYAPRFVPESPRWLLRNGRVEDAYKVLKYMAKVNGSEEVSLETLKVISEHERQEAASATQGKRFGYLDFFREKKLRETTFYMMAIWFAWSFTYYGISYNIKNVPGNIYLNVVLIGISNSVGQRAALLYNDRIGRRRSLFASMSFCALSLVALAGCEIFLEQKSTLLNNCIIALCFSGQLGMSSARSSARLLSGESFPTAVRTMGLGLGGFAANFAGVATPVLAYIGAQWPSIPFFTFALVSVGGSTVSFLMSETTGQPLTDEISSDPKKIAGKLGYEETNAD